MITYSEPITQSHTHTRTFTDDTFLLEERTESINQYLPSFECFNTSEALASPKSSIKDGTHYHTMTAPCFAIRSDAITSVSSRQL